MNKKPRNTTLKQLPAAGKKTKNLPVLVRKKPLEKQVYKQRILTRIGVTLGILGAGGIIIGGAWLSFQFIVNPDTVIWVNQYLPSWTQIPINSKYPPQTLVQIAKKIEKEGLIAGKPIFLQAISQNENDQNHHVGDVLIPVWSTQNNCNNQCDKIVELRLYQSIASIYQRADTDRLYRLTLQQPVEGPAESFVIANLANDKLAQGNNLPLPLTAIQTLPSKTEESGIWLNLIGQRVQNGINVNYGLIVHYNPDRSYLSLMVQWTSAAGQEPTWEDINGDGKPELIIDQTVGLEPQLTVFEVKPRKFLPDPIQLEQVFFNQPAINSREYKDALLLAKSGLWSAALQIIESIKSQEKKWSSQAQMQLEIIRWHARITQTQANAAWSSPSQKILADLIDGRWDKALQILENSLDENSTEINNLLKSDSGRLWRRVETAVKINPGQWEAKAWGALLLTTQKGQTTAIAWLQKQPQTTSQIANKIQDILDQYEVGVFDSKISSRHESQIIGTGTPIASINPNEWLNPQKNEPLKLGEKQIWYQIEISTFNNGKNWLRSPFKNFQLPKIVPGRRLWKLLGLENDPNIQLTTWTPDGQPLTIIALAKAVKFDKGSLQILAAGDPLPENPSSKNNRPLAVTASAFQWIEPNTTTIIGLFQQQPLLAKTILPNLWQELQISGQLPPGNIPQWEDLLQRLGYLSVLLVNLTEDKQPQAVISIQPEDIAILRNPFTATPINNNSNNFRRTLIFANNGRLIYSEFSTNSNQSITGLANFKNNEKPALIVSTANNYTIQRWSSATQKFE